MAQSVNKLLQSKQEHECYSVGFVTTVLHGVRQKHTDDARLLEVLGASNQKFEDPEAHNRSYVSRDSTELALGVTPGL